jgi:cytidylate kinase
MKRAGKPVDNIMKTKDNIIIAIDGHSSTGKSSFAKAIAAHLGYIYVDSGALYRCITLYALQQDLIREQQLDQEALAKVLPHIHIRFSPVENGSQKVWLNGEDVSAAIRSLPISQMVSPISALPFVRNYVDSILQDIGKEKGIVMDGRDIGTVVFPQAEIKIFMTAAPEIRAQRRYDELRAIGENPSFEDILENIRQRDEMDQHRSTAPLRRADDALLLDNSHMSLQDQMLWIQDLIQQSWA